VDSVGMNTDCIASSIWWDGHGKLLVFLTCSIINLKVYEVFHLIIDLKIMSFFSSSSNLTKESLNSDTPCEGIRSRDQGKLGGLFSCLWCCYMGVVAFCFF
jgi:hypothetical protein